MNRRPIILATCAALFFIAAREEAAFGQLFRRRAIRSGPRLVTSTTTAVQVTSQSAASQGSHTAAEDCETGTTPSKPCPSTDCKTTIKGCLPTIESRCKCVISKCWDIKYDYGKLDTINKKTPFYLKCYEITGTINVPVLCVNEVEKYCFRHITLKYDCDEHGKGCTDKQCKIKSCEVFKRLVDCEKTCILKPRKGKLLAALRADGKTVDVFIGKDNADFKEYPANMAVLVNVDEKTFMSSLTTTTTFADIVKNGKACSPFDKP